MHIAIDARSTVWYEGTGIGTYTTELIRHLQLTDLDNQYSLCGVNDPEESFPKRQRFWTRVSKSLVPPDGIDCFHIPHNGFGFPENINCPVVVTIHDVIPFIMPQVCSPEMRLLAHRFIPDVLERATRIICVSHVTSQDLVRLLGIPLSKITVIPEGVSDHFHPCPIDQAMNVLQQYKVQPGFLLYAGGFNRRKNLFSLIDAYARLIRNEPNIPDLVILGSNGYGAYMDLLEYVSKLFLGEHILFPGFIPLEHLAAFYSSATSFIYPTLYEGFGLPVLEAMACGTPVLSSDVSAIPEVAADAALLIDPYQIDQIATGIWRLITDPYLRASLKTKGLQRASQFSWLKTACLTRLVYEEVGR